MVKNISIRKRFGRNSGVVQAIIERLKEHDIHVTAAQVYRATCEGSAAPAHKAEILAAVDYFDNHWDRLREERVRRIKGEAVCS